MQLVGGWWGGGVGEGNQSCTGSFMNMLVVH